MCHFFCEPTPTHSASKLPHTMSFDRRHHQRGASNRPVGNTLTTADASLAPAHDGPSLAPTVGAPPPAFVFGHAAPHLAASGPVAHASVAADIPDGTAPDPTRGVLVLIITVERPATSRDLLRLHFRVHGRSRGLARHAAPFPRRNRASAPTQDAHCINALLTIIRRIRIPRLTRIRIQCNAI